MDSNPSPRHKSLKSNLFLNYLSFALMGASGVLVNFIIGHQRGASALGIFNQVYAVYIIAAQFAVGGVHLSVLRYCADSTRSSRVRHQAIQAGVQASLLLGVGVSFAIYLASGLLGRLLGGAEVAQGLRFMSAGLLFFSINKIFISAINGLGRMKAFAIYQALRPIFILIILFGLVTYGASESTLPFALAAAEGLLFVALAVQFEFWDLSPFRGFPGWISMREHLHFGARGFFSGVVLELNTRVDVFVLGIFLSNQAVGVYSFAATFAEGLYQVLVVLRNYINPMLVDFVARSQMKELLSFHKKVRKVVYLAFFGITAIAVGVFPWIIALTSQDPSFAQAWLVFAILACGVALCSGFIPFDGILIQGGFPFYHTLLSSIIVGANLILNLVLVPQIGLLGAAMGTALASVLGVVLLNVFLKKLLGFHLLMKDSPVKIL